MRERIDIIGEKYHTAASLVSGHVRIVAPASLTLSQNTDQTIGFLQTIREVVPLGANTISVYLKDLKEMSPICAVLFASEMDRMKRLRGGTHRIPNDIGWQSEIKKMLNEIGVFDLVGVDNKPQPEQTEDAERYIKIRSANRVDMERAMRSLLTEVDSIVTFVKSNPHMVGAISEAITNVRQWAYNGMTAEPPTEIRDRWWFLASYNIELRRFSILVYDHGQGIPATLRKLGWEKLKAFLSDELFNDADAIEAAFRVPRSATGESNRGKGLKEMRNLLEKFARGSLRVISGKGEYTYDCNGDIGKRLYNYDIGGTLVAWEIYESDK